MPLKILIVLALAGLALSYTSVLRNNASGTMLVAQIVVPTLSTWTEITFPTTSIPIATFAADDKQSFTVTNRQTALSYTVIVAMPAVGDARACNLTGSAMPSNVDVWSVEQLLAGYNCAVKRALWQLGFLARACDQEPFRFLAEQGLFELYWPWTDVSLSTTYEVARVFGNLAGPRPVSYPPPAPGHPAQFEFIASKTPWVQEGPTFGLWGGNKMVAVVNGGVTSYFPLKGPGRPGSRVPQTVRIPGTVGGFLTLQWVDDSGIAHALWLHHRDAIVVVSPVGLP